MEPGRWLGWRVECGQEFRLLAADDDSPCSAPSSYTVNNTDEWYAVERNPDGSVSLVLIRSSGVKCEKPPSFSQAGAVNSN
jgi:hypothetical protein